MSRKYWRRLAGCIAIECLLTAAPPEYRAGAAASEHARAVVIEDRRGFRAVFAEADFVVTRAVSDLVAVQLVKAGGLERAGIVIRGVGSGAADADEIVGVVAQALLKLDAATVSYAAGAISVGAAGGGCVATLYPVRLGGCRAGVETHGAIRAAFQMIDVPHGLQGRDVEARAYPVQAVAIGKRATVLALGGVVAEGRFAGAGRVVVGGANDSGAMPDGIEGAVARVLRRVR
jgi:hypothetical protein